MNVDGWRRWATVVAAAGTGLTSGVFFAYSTFTMSAIRSLPGTQGLRTMQAVNRSAERSAGLMVALFGTAAVCVALAVAAWREPRSTGAMLQIAAAAVFLLGVLAMTIGFHVPRNEALAMVDPTAPSAAGAWSSYARAWTAGNHVRALCGATASVLFAASLVTA